MRRLSSQRVIQRGFTLVELIIAISISALLSVYAQTVISKQVEESLAEGSATYILAVANAVQQHALLNWNEYSNGLPVAGVAVPLQPTIAEMVALGRLNPGFPSAANSLPTRQSLGVTIQATACPGPACQLQILACTTTPVTLGGANVRFDLASTMMSAQKGAGGQSLPGQGATIRGPVVNAPNPYGNVEGIVCGTSSVDTALFQRFLTLNDARDPNFQGPFTAVGAATLNGATAVNNTLTVTGATALNNTLTVTGATTLNNNLNVTGTATVAGVTTLNGATIVNNTLDVTGAATVTGRIQGDRLVPSSLQTAGTACLATDDGAIARRAGATGLVVCQGLVWRNLSVGGASGDACTVEGMAATASNGIGLVCINGQLRGLDTLMRSGTPGVACTVPGALGYDTASNNEGILCRANPDPLGGGARWMRLRDITSNLSFVQSLEVTEGTVVAKPACTPAAGMTSIPVIQLIPKSFSSPDGGFAFYADSAAGWTVRMRDGAGAVLAGTPYAVAQVWCYYP